MNTLSQHILRAAFALLATTGLAQATATAYEPFDYAAGSLGDGTAATGNGFSGNWTCGTAATIVSGLTYTGLPAANNALQSSGARQFVHLSGSLSSGTQWISFLYKTSPGNPGANINGVYFPNDNADCLWFGFGLSPYSGTQGQLGLGSIATAGTAATSATSLELLGLGTYGDIYLVVLKVEFNTSGNNDTVTVYLNPATNQATPGVGAAGVHTNFDVGTITGVGLNVTGAGEIIVDEIRVGDSYADVVDAVTVAPDAPTGLNAVPGTNRVSLSWTAANGTPTTYNVKRSSSYGGPYTTIGTTTAPSVTYNDTVPGGQTYYYVVSAANSVGESADSMPASVTPFEPLPLMADIAPGAGISWFASNSVTYQVQWADEDLGMNTVWNNLGSSIIGDGTTNTVFDPAGSPHEFYRVLSFQ